MALITRDSKGEELTYDEVDGNFIYLNNKNAIADTAPTADDNETKGFIVGSEWKDLSDNLKVYECTDNTTDDAVWEVRKYGVSQFISLSDAPEELTADKILRVSDTGTAIFCDLPTLIEAKDSPDSYEDNAGKILNVNDDENAMEFIDFKLETLKDVSTTLSNEQGITFRTDDTLKVHTNTIGTTDDRPQKIEDSMCYFDTDLSKPIWFFDGDWYDADGTVI